MKSNLLFATAVIIGLGACDVLKQTATQVATETLTQAISGGEGNAKPALTSAEAAGVGESQPTRSTTGGPFGRACLSAIWSAAPAAGSPAPISGVPGAGL